MDLLHMALTSQTEGLIPFLRPNDMRTSINTMPDDILLHIFSINANMKNDVFRSEYEERRFQALYITRRTSHVSQRWRELLLGSPTIWAGLIDLDMFRMEVANDWREEVIRRSGAVLLSVKGYLIVAQYSLVTLSFFKNYWDRIQNLNVIAYLWNGSEKEVWLDILSRPSPHLRSFSFLLDPKPGGELYEFFPNRNKPDVVLFSDHAPSLREFHKSSITAFMRAPWLSHLRVLDLIFNRNGHVLNVAHILSGLAGMNLLEHLTIDMGKCRWTATDNPDQMILPVTLPSLRHMNVKSRELKNCVILLKNIVPQQGCSIFLDAHGSNGEDNLYSLAQIRLHSLAQIIAQHSQNYFGFGGITPLSIELKISEKVFEFAAHIDSWSFTPFDFSRYPDHIVSFHHYLDRNAGCPVPDFKVKIDLNGLRPPPPVDLTLFSSVISSIPVAALGLVTALKISLSTGYFANQKVDPLEVAQFVASLTSVETLVTYTHTLTQLNHIHISDSKSFPALRTLKMMDSGLEVGGGEYRADPSIVDFLKLRAEEGLALSGLQIVWKHGKIRQYVCGAGKPGLLSKAS